MKILVAEDDEINQEVIRILLEEENYNVDVVSNGAEVLQKLEKVEYDLILMDIQMPELDGYETTKIIREREDKKKKMPIIAVTAYATEADKEKLFNVGVTDYLSKPLKMQEVVTSINSVINNDG